MSDNLLYKLRSGKPLKFLYMIKGYMKLCIPDCFFVWYREKYLQSVANRDDWDYINDRVNYYVRLEGERNLPTNDIHDKRSAYYVFLDTVSAFKTSTFHKAYYFDLKDVIRWFGHHFRIGYIPGDVYFTPQFPAIVKSRLLSLGNQNSVILKLDKLRHFMFVKDSKSFAEKKNQAIFRGKIRSSCIREAFIRRYFGSSICDCGVVGKNEGCPDEWMVPKKTIREHLDYKFIMALEGNDVASNLKWVMSSNSIAVMTRPTCETWFMEGRLIPNYHYIEIKDDLSDLEERLNYYISHQDEAQLIIKHAHEFVAQFFDDRRERIISLLVMEKYLKVTRQID